VTNEMKFKSIAQIEERLALTLHFHFLRFVCFCDVWVYVILFGDIVFCISWKNHQFVCFDIMLPNLTKAVFIVHFSSWGKIMFHSFCRLVCLSESTYLLSFNSLLANGFTLNLIYFCLLYFTFIFLVIVAILFIFLLQESTFY